MHKVESPLATTGFGPIENLLRTKLVATDLPGDTAAEGVVSDARSVASTKNSSNTSRMRERIHRSQLRGVKLRWYLPSLIVGLLILGLLGSLLHHRFYLSLDYAPAEDQLKVAWFGNALAFLTKAALAGSITLAYRLVWTTGLWQQRNKRAGC